MSKRISTFIKATLDQEDWLPPFAEREGADKAEVQQLVATAAITRGVAQSVDVPPGAEEASRLTGVAHLTRMKMDQPEAPAPPDLACRVGGLVRGVLGAFGKKK